VSRTRALHQRVWDTMRSPGAWRSAAPCLAVLAAVLLANLLYISGAVISSPLVTRAHVDLSVSAGFAPANYTLDPNDGFSTQALGVGAARQLLGGQMPWWNPLAGMGAPLVAGMQSAALFPGTLVQALPGGTLLLRLLLEVLAGCSSVMVLRHLGVRRIVAGIGGVLFALNGALAWFHHAAATPIAFLPMLIWGLERAHHATLAGKRGGYLTLAAALALSLYAGFPETAYLSGLLAGVWFGWRTWTSRGHRRLLVLKTAAGVSLGLLLSAPAVGPFLAYVADGADIGGHVDVFANRGLPWGSLGNIVTPYAYGPLGAFFGTEVGGRHLYQVWADIGGYTTISVVVLAAAGLWCKEHRGLRIALAAWILISLGKTFALPVVSTLANLIPGIKLAAFYRYAYATWIFALIILAMLALEDLAKRRLTRAPVIVAGTFGALGLLVCWRQAEELVARNTDTRMQLTSAVSYGYGAASVAVLVLLLLWGLARKPRLAVVLIGLALGTEAIAFATIPTLSSPRSWQPDTQLVAFLQEQGAAAESGSSLGRIYSLTDRLDPNYGTYYGVAQLNVNDLPVPQLWAAYVTKRLDPAASPGNFYLYDLSPTSVERTQRAFIDNVQGFRDAAVRWVITAPEDLSPGLAHVLQPVLTTPTATVSELRGARSYVSTTTGPSCTVESISRTQHVVTCPEATTLVRRELALPGWSASVDGQPAHVAPYDTYFQAVDVPAGTHSVRFTYMPAGGIAGLTMFGLGLLLTSASVVSRTLGRRRPPAATNIRKVRPRLPPIQS
jgi:hypothetical protein